MAPPTELCFINTSGAPALNVRKTPGNKIVRAHVMRRYKRQQKEAAQQGQICRSSLDGIADPFQSFAVALPRRCLMLLHANVSSNIRTSVHADPSDVYNSSCSKDPAWLFMTLFYASSRFDLHSHVARGSGRRSPETTAYLLQAIASVNMAIAQSPFAVTDSALATVACLANIENLDGTLADAAVHVMGLRRMIELRGGLSDFGTKGIVRRMVQWSDLLASSRLQRRPHLTFFLPIDEDDNLPLSQFTNHTAIHEYDITLNPALATIVTRRHNVSIPTLLISLHELSTFLNLAGGGGDSQLYLPWDAAYPDRLYAVEYRILLALFDEDDNNSNNNNNNNKDHNQEVILDTASGWCAALWQHQLCTVLLHAMLLFIYTNLRETPVGGVLRARLVQRLQHALIMTGMVDDLVGMFPGEMLWVSMLGTTAAAAIASGGVAEYELSVMSTVLSQIRHEYDLRGWTEVRVFLTRMPAFVGPFAMRCMEFLQRL